MQITQHNKLVRDKIPQNITINWDTAIFTVTRTQKEFNDLLFEKLREEVGELIKDKNVEELADVYEVSYEICKIFNVVPREVERLIQANTIPTNSTQDSTTNTQEEFQQKLFWVLEIRTNELIENKKLSELVEVCNVLQRVGMLLSITPEEIEKVRLEKREKNWGFEQWIVLIETLWEK